MINIIDKIEDALHSDNYKQTLMQHPTDIWKENFPIAIINHTSRIERSSDIEFLKTHKLLDNEGFTPQAWDKQMLTSLSKNTPVLLQTSALVLLKSHPNKKLLFINKRKQDRWKKIDASANIDTIFEQTPFEAEEDLCSLEFKFREIIRKRKEVHALKELGFIWMSEVSRDLDVSKILKHYFQDNFRVITIGEKNFYIGWNAQLNDISMRYFVCPPIK